jgi:hypothetical protein
MNAMFARKDFLNWATFQITNERTLETNLMNVMFATKDFRIRAT